MPHGPITPGQRLLGRGNVAAIASLLATLLKDLLEPDSLLCVLQDSEASGFRVLLADNYGNPRPDDSMIRLALAGPELLNRKQQKAAGANALFRTWMGAPIKGAAGQTIGALALGSERNSWNRAEHLPVLTAALAQAGVALDNAQLLQILSEGKREWEQTVDAMNEAFCVVDAAGVVRRANRAFASMVKHPLTGLRGRPWISLLPTDWTDAVARALAVSESAAVELPFADRLYSLAVLRLDGTEGVSLLSFSDQTDKRRLQEQLIQSEKMSAIGQLIAGVAHDLNNPLASVVGFADYLVETERDAPPQLLEPLRAIQQEAERAAAIVHNLLSFARKQERRRVHQPLRPVLEATLLLLRNQLMACKVTGHLDVEPGLPDVTMDANQVQQVFVNLVNNAAQAMHGSRQGENVWVRAGRWLDGVAVTVEDDGPGVPDDIADRVFEPFFTTKPEGQGTGLGLTICHGIVREHGGRIVLSKRAGGGAAFRVELPAGDAAHAPAVVRDTVTTGHLRVLVVDDEPHILHYMRATLETWGHGVAIAADGSDALARIEHEPFDVIITDIRMPHLGGREMYETLRRQRPDLAARVVFSTGDTVRGDTLAFLESLGRPYLRKPFSLGELRSALGSVATSR